MSSDFYLKHQSLYEEFQKKELLYLDAEKKLNSSLMWKKNENVNLQEYLQKINERGKKNIETYQCIMKQMDELDEHTDLLSLKLEKLGIFHNIQAGHSLKESSHLFTLSNVSQNLNAVQSFNTEPINSQLESSRLKSLESKSVSTQTDSNVYCDNCKSLIQLSFQSIQMENLTSSTIDILSVSKDETDFVNSAKSGKDSFMPLHRNDNDSQFITSSMSARHIPLEKQHNDNFIDEKFRSNQHTNEKYQTKSLDDNAILDEKPFSLQSNEVLATKNTSSNSGDKKGKTESQSKLNESEINVEIRIAKNDTGSVNDEFDFLESDTTHLPSKMRDQNSSKNIDQAVSSEIQHNNKSAIPNKSATFREEKSFLVSNTEQEINDYKSETSGSVSGTRSPIISVSDSDSMDEKGSLLTSAVYQSMLGNTVLAKTKKKVSESESEDEIEKTLARTMQKPNIKSKSSSQPKKEKSIPQPLDSKSVTNKPKPISVNKPQSKLSKNTKARIFTLQSNLV